MLINREMTNKATSVVYEHFVLPTNRSGSFRAQCKYCDKSILTSGTTTSNLLQDLQGRPMCSTISLVNHFFITLLGYDIQNEALNHLTVGY